MIESAGIFSVTRRKLGRSALVTAATCSLLAARCCFGIGAGKTASARGSQPRPYARPILGRRHAPISGWASVFGPSRDPISFRRRAMTFVARMYRRTVVASSAIQGMKPNDDD